MRGFPRAKHFHALRRPGVPWPRRCAAVTRGAAPQSYRLKAEVMAGKEAAFPSTGRPSNRSAVPSRE
jgi:hypothetical protein